MSSLYGIESEQDCRSEIDQLLQSPALLGAANKDTIADLKSRLKEFYKKGDSDKGQSKMSKVESAYFWPAIRDAYVNAPNLNSPRSWQTGLNDIEDYLRYHRPEDPRKG
jgi:hypothetical protein